MIPDCDPARCGDPFIKCDKDCEHHCNMSGELAQHVSDLRVVGSVDITPTPDGFKGIAMVFGDSIIGDVPIERRADSKKLLASLINIAGWLGQNHPALLAELQEWYER